MEKEGFRVEEGEAMPVRPPVVGLHTAIKPLIRPFTTGEFNSPGIFTGDACPCRPLTPTNVAQLKHSRDLTGTVRYRTGTVQYRYQYSTST
eukprot:4414171-Pyramimonas_sp.AAC.1